MGTDSDLAQKTKYYRLGTTYLRQAFPKEEINALNESFRQLVTEREWLLKEVHHRLKNNLQIVTSLLNSKSAYIDSPSAKEAILESKNQVNPISLIHSRLYQRDDLVGVDMQVYLNELIDFIADGFSTKY